MIQILLNVVEVLSLRQDSVNCSEGRRSQHSLLSKQQPNRSECDSDSPIPIVDSALAFR